MGVVSHPTPLSHTLHTFRILKSLGFDGGTFTPILQNSMQLWHCYALCSKAFFNSPRGRWSMHFLCELLFLVLYQLLVRRMGGEGGRARKRGRGGRRGEGA